MPSLQYCRSSRRFQAKAVARPSHDGVNARHGAPPLVRRDPPPAPVRAVALRLAAGLHGVRWLEDAQLHVTLRFIGEVDRHQAEDCAAALGRVRHPPLPLALGAPGQFERHGRAMLWLGVTPRAPLAALHRSIDAALVRDAGLPPEGRAYLPHLTLGRAGRAAGPLDAFLAAAAPETRFEAGEFRLYESMLTTDGAVYEEIARYPLR